MDNIFSFRMNDSPDDMVSISDRGTQALIHILILAAAELAQTDSQKRLAVWLAEHDGKRGSGSSGFCIARMPWAAESFEEDRRFMVAVTDAASQQTGWKKLSYTPNAERLMPMLGWFHKCFMRLKRADIDETALTAWLAGMDEEDPVMSGFPRCERHGVYETWLGCPICLNR